MAPASNSSEGGRLVMVVDDSATMRRSVQMTLEHAGYRVVTADGGEQALQLLAQGVKPDLLLTDIVMPGMGGIELIRQARQKLRFTPIVALTTQTTQKYRDEGKAAGATAWSLKPTGGHKLLELVACFIQPASGTRR